MIPKAEMLAVATETGLLPTTVEKDYALGWVLYGIAQHTTLRDWLFKGGTCLKKCYFDTYRFSEDLDFTVPPDTPYDPGAIRDSFLDVARWAHEQSGLEFPPEGIDVAESVNKRGQRTYQARMTYVGPLQLSRANRQRVRFDLTSDEIVVEPAEHREVFHGYSDVPDQIPRVRCYSLAEILAEKIRALVERSGRARDVYDVVNVGRNLRTDLPRDRIATLTAEKFAFKDLDSPEPDGILARIDPEVLETDWSQSLRHQLPVLPPVEDFLAALREILDWLLGGAVPPALAPVPGRRNEVSVDPIRFRPPLAAIRPLRLGTMASRGTGPEAAYGTGMDRLRYAARNRLLARVDYHGVSRLVEPYSLRMPKTGNLLLYVFERERGGGPGEGIKAFKVAELGEVAVTDNPFQPQYLVEL